MPAAVVGGASVGLPVEDVVAVVGVVVVSAVGVVVASVAVGAVVDVGVGVGVAVEAVVSATVVVAVGEVAAAVASVPVLVGEVLVASVVALAGVDPSVVVEAGVEDVGVGREYLAACSRSWNACVYVPARSDSFLVVRHQQGNT